MSSRKPSTDIWSALGLKPPNSFVVPEAPVRFPSFDEVLQHEEAKQLHPLLQLGQTPPSRPTSIFEGLLGGQLEVLLDDVARRPEQYDEQTRQFLEDLGSGVKKLTNLTEGERAHLDRATLDFAAYQRPPRAPAVKKPVTLRRPPPMKDLEDGRAPQVEAPGGVMTPYWWLT